MRKEWWEIIVKKHFKTCAKLILLMCHEKEMVKMHDQYNKDKVVFVSMNLDDREDLESLAAAEKFLMSMSAQFDHYRMNENLMRTFEKTNLIGIPAILIYDQKGKERYRLTGDNPNKQFTEHDI